MKQLIMLKTKLISCYCLLAQVNYGDLFCELHRRGFFLHSALMLIAKNHFTMHLSESII